MLLCGCRASYDAAPPGREEPGERAGFALVRVAELVYQRRLRGVARVVAELLKGHDPLDPHEMATYEDTLRRYAAALSGWARVQAERMLVDVSRRDARAWRRHTSEMGRALREEVQSAPTGRLLRQLQDEQVVLITSLPTEAAERVHRLTREGLSTGVRPAEVAREIVRTGHVTRSRADLIARTEVGRASTALVQARAQHVGSEGYVWRTANDSAVRPSHRAMRGKFVRWDEPPELDGLTGHAGSLPNCRCHCSPILAD